MMEYNVWIIYIKTDDVSDCDKFDIYAYTSSKKMFLLFKNSRNMDKFYVKKEKLTKQELNDLYYNHMNSQLVMFNVFFKDDNYHIHNVDMVVTQKEKQDALGRISTIIHSEIFKYVWINDYPFKEKYQKALRTLLYTGFYNYITTGGDGIWQDVEWRIIELSFPCLLDFYSDLFP